jgi:hypothetical protein
MFDSNVTNEQVGTAATHLMCIRKTPRPDTSDPNWGFFTVFFVLTAVTAMK